MEIHMLFFFFASVFCAEVQKTVGTHHLVLKRKTWKDAQTHCRNYYTDLSYVNDQNDTEKIREAAGGLYIRVAWIGLTLQQDRTKTTRWKWSGGGYVTYTNWAKGQPDNYKGKETKGLISFNGQWFDLFENYTMPFFCIKVSVMKKKIWEDAMEHCREEHSDLISIVSETDHVLAQAAMQRSQLTEPVWIGLRFLADQWVWVDGKPMVYTAWNEEGNYQQCPVRRCGALTSTGLWDHYDCVEKRYFLCA